MDSELPERKQCFIPAAEEPHAPAPRPWVMLLHTSAAVPVSGGAARAGTPPCQPLSRAIPDTPELWAETASCAWGSSTTLLCLRTACGLPVQPRGSEDGVKGRMAQCPALGHISQLPGSRRSAGAQLIPAPALETSAAHPHKPQRAHKSPGASRRRRRSPHLLQRCRELAGPGRGWQPQQSSLAPQHEWLCQLRLCCSPWKLLSGFQAQGQHTWQKRSAYSGSHGWNGSSLLPD